MRLAVSNQVFIDKIFSYDTSLFFLVFTANRPDHNKLTAENLASLRWENVLTDSKLENERIERYKELRRQRYNDARENALRNILEQMRLAATTTTTVDNSTGLVEIDQ